MTLRVSLTGSYPPIYNPDKPEEGIRHLPIEKQDEFVHRSIERAIHDQIELGIDVLVDGQTRDDIVSLFATRLPGYAGEALPYRATGPIRPSAESITVQDYLYAKKLAGDKPLKAHITGPMTMARGTFVDTPEYTDRNDPKLVYDLAVALGQEAKFLVQAGAEIVQIDEPVLADGVNLDVAFEAMKQIVEIGEIPFPGLHACGNVSRILDDVLTRSPFKMISIEGSWLKQDELSYIDCDYLRGCGKQIGLGCMPVSDYTPSKVITVQNFVDQMVFRLGEENIWAAMPNCGLRFVPYKVALEKLRIMVEAVKSL